MTRLLQRVIPARHSPAPWLVPAMVMLALLSAFLISRDDHLWAFGLVFLVACAVLLMLTETELGVTVLLLGIFAASGRRLVDHVAGSDVGIAVFLPLAVVSAVVLLDSAGRWAGHSIDLLDKAVLCFCGVAVLGLAIGGDPLQSLIGGPAVFIPFCWYLAGRTLFRPEQVTKLLWVVAAASLVVAAIGLAQSFGHFFAFDRTWAQEADFSSLSLGGGIRAFGTLSSPAEYSRVLGIGLVLLVLLPARNPTVLLVRAAGVLLLGMAIFYSGVRSAVVLTALAIIAIVAVSRLVSPAAKVIVTGAALVVAVALFGWGEAAGSGSELGSIETSAVAADRQIAALQDPFDSEASTLLSHVQNTRAAISNVPSDPLGAGTLVITPVADELGTVRRGGDGDVARAVGAWGVLGLGSFTFLLVAVVHRLWVANRRLASRLGPVALALATVTLLQWLNPGFYVVPIIFWLTMGALISDLERLRRQASAVPAPTTTP